MQRFVGESVLEFVIGDITQQSVDAIVNAANARLAGGGGVDGAIHRAGGSAIMEETDRRYPEGCPTGSAVVSGAGNLPAKFVFHAVGPVWYGGKAGEPEQLANAYRTCLELALQYECDSIAFPAISTGVYGYPPDLAAAVCLQACMDFLKAHQAPRLIRFVLFSEGAWGAFARVLEELD